VYYLVDGSVAAVGSHRDLLDGQPGYRLLVSRGADDDDSVPVGDGGGSAPREATS
jgi:hypothetical protein